VEPRSVLGRGFNCSDAGSLAGRIWFSSEGRPVGHYMSVSGGAFLQSHANAMTDQTTSASVCEGCKQVAGCDPCVRMPVL
jgi:hypothetical protein